MARVRGRDILLDLMETVAALKEESANSRARFDAMQDQLLELSSGARRQEGHLARLAKLLGQMAENTSNRFERLEARVDAIESRH